MGSTFASLRGDRVIAIDANPDAGTLADREHREHRYTVRDLLADHHIRTYSDVRHYTSQGDSRLEILANETDPVTSEAVNEQDYLDALKTLEVHYNIIITDCGTGMMHSAMKGILGVRVDPGVKGPEVGTGCGTVPIELDLDIAHHVLGSAAHVQMGAHGCQHLVDALDTVGVDVLLHRRLDLVPVLSVQHGLECVEAVDNPVVVGELIEVGWDG